MDKKRIVIIGAVALGPKVACRLKRLRPDFAVTMVDQDEYISYGGCGIPYYISGDLSDIKELMSTSFHMLRTPEFFESAKDVRVMTRTRALAVDRGAKTVRARRLDTGREEDLPYDKLVLATGSRARRLEVFGGDLPQVMRVANLRDALAVREKISQGRVGKAVIIGAGPLGLEMAEALSDLWGVETTLVEIAPQVLPGVLDPGLARMVSKNLEDHDVTVHFQETVKEIRAGDGEHALRVVTSNRLLDADLVLTCLGVMPNSQLAADTGLDGYNRTVDVAEFEKCFLTEQAGDLICLDVRGAQNAAPYVDLFGPRWRNIPQETLKDRFAEIPTDKRLVVVCNSGVRSYEALRQLETAGLGNAVNLQGGVAALKKSGLLEGGEEKD
jgi:NADPH-dependent 2,4-dienoyl-CoA reductase/sulfur reductase-like enzyme